MAGGVTTHSLPDPIKEQLLLDQLAKDPLGRHGPQTVMERLALDTGVHLTQCVYYMLEYTIIDCWSSDYIRNFMLQHNEEGFALREPTAKKVIWQALVSLGIHHEWSCDGHDKLNSCGFQIYGVKDKWSGKWLGLWVVPNNRYKIVIAYLWLSLMIKYKGKTVV